MTYDAIIIGGGLAGCSTAIQLARRGHRVALLEKQRYPVHKLCGEFLSVETQGLFERLGVLDAVRDAGACEIDRVLLSTTAGTAYESALPGTALGLSRYTLDHLLFQQAHAAGATALDGTAATEVAGTLAEGFTVRTRDDAISARLVVGAYGKRSVLDRKLERPFLARHHPYVGFKAHYEGIELAGLIEMHAFPGGYCGLSQVEGGRVNVCWIGREDALKRNGGTPESMLAAACASNPLLDRQMRRLHRVSASFKAVSQVSFSPRTAWAGDVCMVGDTAGMIAPMCGDGMAMALRSAEIAAPLLDAFLNTQQRPADLKQHYEARWNREFSLRMRLGRWLHHAYGHPTVSRLGVAVCRQVPALGRWFIRNTRG